MDNEDILYECIFGVGESGDKTIVPFVKDFYEVEKMYKVVNECDGDEKVKTCYDVLCMLFEVMKRYPPLVGVLSPVNKRELLYEMLINKYMCYVLEMNSNNEYVSKCKRIIIDIINFIKYHIDITPKVYKIIYSKLTSLTFYSINDNTTSTLTATNINDILLLLQSLYINDKDTYHNKKQHFPLNYFIFNNNAKLSLSSHLSSSTTNTNLNLNDNINEPTLMLWFYFPEYITTTSSSSSPSLFEYASSNVICGVYISFNYSTLTFKHNEYTQSLDITLQRNKWYLLTIDNTSQHVKKFIIALYSFNEVDRFIKETYINIKCSFLSQPLSSYNNVELFKNYNGIAGSVVLFNGINNANTLTSVLDAYTNTDKHLNKQLKQLLKHGITSNKVQTYFFDVFINNEIKQSRYFNIELYITPCNAYTLSNNNELIIESVNYYVHSQQELNMNKPLLTYKWMNTLINSYHNLQTKIHLIGNITALLPLFEFMLLHNNNNDSLCNSNNFELLITIIVDVIKRSYCNYSNALCTNFYECLSLFLENISANMYSLTIWAKLKELHEAYFDYADILHKEYSPSQVTAYYKYIFFNCKIIMKFDKDIQIAIFNKNIKEMLTAPTTSQHYTQITKCFTLKTLCYLLLKIDKTKYVTYCCTEHKSLITIDNANTVNNVNKPELYEVYALYSDLTSFLLTLTLTTASTKDDFMLFINLLSLDISPCLQMFILKQLGEVLSPVNDNMNKEMIRVSNDINVNDIKLLLMYLCSNSIVNVRSIVVDMFNKGWWCLEKNVMKKERYFKVNKDDLEMLKYFVIPYECDECSNEDNIKEGYDLERNDEFKNYVDGFNRARGVEVGDKEVVDMFRNVHPKMKCKEMVYYKIAERVSKFYVKEKERWNSNNNSNNNNGGFISLDMFIYVLGQIRDVMILQNHITKITEVFCSNNNNNNSNSNYITTMLNEDKFMFNFVIELGFQCSYSLTIDPNNETLINVNNEINKLLALYTNSANIQHFPLVKLYTWITYSITTINSIKPIYSEYKCKLQSHLYTYINDVIITPLINNNNTLIQNTDLDNIKYSASLIIDIIFHLQFIFHNVFNFICNKSTYSIEMFPESNRDNTSFPKYPHYILNNNKEEEQQHYDYMLPLIEQSLKHILYILSYECDNNNNNNQSTCASQAKFVSKKQSPQSEQLNKFKTTFLINTIDSLYLTSTIPNDYLKQYKLIHIPLLKSLTLLYINYIHTYHSKSTQYLTIIHSFITSLISIAFRKTQKNKDFINQVELSLIFIYQALSNIYNTTQNIDITIIFIETFHYANLISSIQKTLHSMQLFKETNISQITDNYWLNHLNILLTTNNANSSNWYKDIFCKEMITNNSKYLICEIQSYVPVCKSIIPLHKVNRSMYKGIAVHYNCTDISNDKYQVMKMIYNYITNVHSKVVTRLSGVFHDMKVNKKICYHSYYKVKKQLFSWNGFWGKWELFYKGGKRYKEKVINHRNNDFVEFLLKPIMDVKYYLPEFREFDIKGLFINGDIEKGVLVNLNVPLLFKRIKGKIHRNEDNDNSKTYLHSFYVNKIVFKINVNNTHYVTHQSTLTSNNNSNTPIKVCRVKKTHHIMCMLLIKENGLYFEYKYSKHGTGIHPDELMYDPENKTCYSSYMKHYPKDKIKSYLYISFDSIYLILKRNYFYSTRALEIFTESKSYYFHFTNDTTRKHVYSQLKAKLSKNIKKLKSRTDNKTHGLILNDSHLRIGFSSLSDAISKFQTYELSSLKFLMICNILGNRSYNDLTQYHVFPWIISDYHSMILDTKNNSKSVFRNLELPMGMIVNSNNESRKDMYIEEYKLLQSEYQMTSNKKANDDEGVLNNINNSDIKHMNANEREIYYENYNNMPYHYGTNYSNPLYVSHYLIRLFPYTQVRIECQGNNFDSTRLFKSMLQTYESATTIKTDIRELIPEFYILPEMLLNINDLTLGLNVINSNENDVELPGWSKGKAYKLIQNKRKALEYKRKDLWKWMELIFGYKQTASHAVKAGNVFMRSSYHDVEIYDEKRSKKESNELVWVDTFYRMVEIGLIPVQLMKTQVKLEMNPYIEAIMYKKSISIEQYEYGSVLNGNGDEIVKVVKCGNGSNNNNNSSMMVITKMCKVFPLVKGIKDEKEFNVYNEILKHKFICKACVSNNIPQKLLCVAFDNNTKLLLANTFDNSILIIDIKTTKIIQTIYINAIYHGNYHITALSLSKYEDRIVFATEIGSILLCNIKLNKKQLPHNSYNIKVIKTVTDHLNEVNNIELNTDMNVLISSDINGYVNIYTLPNVKLIRNIKLKIIPYAQLLMVSSAYVPCVVCYCNGMFEVFTINGSYVDVKVEKEWKGKVRSYAVFSTMLNKQFLILGLMNGKVEIRELPELKMRRTLQVIPGDNKKEEIIGVLPVEQNSIYVYSRNNVFHIYNDIM